MAAKETNLVNAEKLLAKLPKALRDESEVVDRPGKAYTILKVRGSSVASVRDNAIRIVHAYDGSAGATAAFAKQIEDAAPEPKPKKPTAGEKAAADEAKQKVEAEAAVAATAEGDKGDGK
jgi:hypothetical protein